MRPSKKPDTPHIRMHYQLFIDGKAVTRRLRSHSWLKAFAQGLYAHFSGVTVSIKDITNTDRSIAAGGSTFSNSGPVDNSDTGIVVGTDGTDETFSDYALLSKITTGNGAGQLRYLAQTWNGPTIDSTSLVFQEIRSFINNSGNTITVREIGIQSLLGSSGTYKYLTVRDNLSVAVDVLAGKTLTVTYTITISI